MGSCIYFASIIPAAVMVSAYIPLFSFGWIEFKVAYQAWLVYTLQRLHSLIYQIIK